METSCEKGRVHAMASTCHRCLTTLTTPLLPLIGTTVRTGELGTVESSAVATLGTPLPACTC